MERATCILFALGRDLSFHLCPANGILLSEINQAEPLAGASLLSSFLVITTYVPMNLDVEMSQILSQSSPSTRRKFRRGGQSTSTLVEALQKSDLPLHAIVKWWAKKRKKAEETATDVKQGQRCHSWVNNHTSYFEPLYTAELTELNKVKEDAFGKTDENKQTALHLSLLHRMPEQFILALVEKMQSSQLDEQDNNRCRAIDYLVS